MPMGMPGWPEFAASTASMERARIAVARRQWAGSALRRAAMSISGFPCCCMAARPDRQEGGRLQAARGGGGRFRMTRHHAIIGFRQDRIGARLICLLNVMRIARKFGVAGRYLWLSQPDGPYPELVDPRDFLDPAFVAAHIDIVARAP